MEFTRRQAYTPNRFLSVRAQRTTSSAASSGDRSPRFATCRQATTPSRVTVAPNRLPMANATMKPGDAWPTFGDAVRRRDASLTIFGIRKRGAINRATDIHSMSLLGETRLPLARRLRSEPGAVPNGATNARLSPTATDWVPKPTPRSPQCSALSYADVVKISDGRPPPPFPILGKLNPSQVNAQGPHISARQIVKNSSGDGSETSNLQHYGRDGKIPTTGSSSSQKGKAAIFNAKKDLNDENVGADYVKLLHDGEVDYSQALSELHQRATLLGFGSSPFLPQTPAEYAEFRASIATQEREKKNRKAQPLDRDLIATVKEALEGVTPMRAQSRPTNGLSCVLRKKTVCLGGQRPSYEISTVPWPGTLELWQAGNGEHCHLPQPRCPQVSSNLDSRQGHDRYGLGYGLKQAEASSYKQADIVSDRWDWLSSVERTSISKNTTIEIDPKTTHELMQDLLDFICKPETWDSDQVDINKDERTK